MSVADLRAIQQPTFGLLETIDGWDVIDNATGRPLDHRPTKAQANGVVYKLNQAEKAGAFALGKALRN